MVPMGCGGNVVPLLPATVGELMCSRKLWTLSAMCLIG